MAVEVFMSKMSDFMEHGVVVALLVQEGEYVQEGQALVEVETDKALAELEAPASGFIKGLRAGVSAGAQVPVGETIAYIVESMDDPVEALGALGDGAR